MLADQMVYGFAVDPILPFAFSRDHSRITWNATEIPDPNPKFPIIKGYWLNLIVADSPFLKGNRVQFSKALHVNWLI